MRIQSDSILRHSSGGIVVQVWPGLSLAGWLGQAEGLTQSELPAMAPEPSC